VNGRGRIYQGKLFHGHRGNRRVTAPFLVDSSEVIGSYRRISWRLLSYRYPKIQARMGHDSSPKPWHFEMIIRNEVQPRDLHLIRNSATDRLEEVEVASNHD
jgi:hypothetical protein